MAKKKKTKWHNEKIIWTAKAVRSPSLSTNYEDRWILVDKSTGEIVDDAQGYGFTTEKKAYACYAYYYYKDKEVLEWADCHTVIVDKVRKLPVINAKTVKQIFRDTNTRVSFGVKEFLRVYHKYLK